MAEDKRAAAQASDAYDFPWDDDFASGPSGTPEDDDAEMRALFGAYDKVEASRALRTRTLKALLANDDASHEDGAAVTYEVANDAAVPASLANKSQTGHKRFFVPNQSGGRRRPHKRSRRLRLIAALALGFVLVLALSWVMPVTNVALAQDGLEVELGINVYGITVSARSSNEDGEELLLLADVRNHGYEDALERLFDTYENLYPNRDLEDVSVEESSVVGPHGERVGAELRRQIDGRVARRREESAGQSSEREVGQGNAGQTNPQAEPQQQPGQTSDQGQGQPQGEGSQQEQRETVPNGLEEHQDSQPVDGQSQRTPSGTSQPQVEGMGGSGGGAAPLGAPGGE